MSDNLPPEVVQEELEARLRIPTEVWTDVFKLLPRRVLVQQIAPVCYYFKEISDKNVKNVHVIENATQFSNKLRQDNPETNKQVEYLAGNDCNLADQFKLSEMWISNEKGQAILRNCPDLFSGCQVKMFLGELNKNSPLFLECLSHLRKAKPVEISVNQNVDQVLLGFWHHPTFQNCTRLDFYFRTPLSAANQLSTCENIFEWLHHQPSGMNSDGASATKELVRSMIFWFSGIGNNRIDWLINRCSEKFQQSQEVIDRRPFVLSFLDSEWTGFERFHRIANKPTGEVLTLERKMRDNGQPTNEYRLRRCLAKEEANGPDFYAGMFKRNNGFDEFKLGNGMTRIVIE